MNQLERNEHAQHLICLNCHHKQIVIPAAAHLNAEGNVELYFGSARHFCEKCDGEVDLDPKFHKPKPQIEMISIQEALAAALRQMLAASGGPDGMKCGVGNPMEARANAVAALARLEKGTK